MDTNSSRISSNFVELQSDRAPQHLETNGSSRFPRRRSRVVEPLLGQPGGRDDPNRKGLNGSCTKWYIRYLKQGFAPAIARMKALEHRQGANDINKGTLGTARKRSKSPLEISPKKARSCEPKRSVENRVPNPEKNVKVVVIPVGYPKEVLAPEDLPNLEEAILMQIAKDCHGEMPANWLMREIPKLSTWKGKPIEGQLGDEFPSMHNISLYLPNSANKSEEFLLSLIRNQNMLCTDTWKVLSQRNEGNDCHLTICVNNRTMKQIAAKENKLWFRFGAIPVIEEEVQDDPILPETETDAPIQNNEFDKDEEPSVILINSNTVIDLSD
ncbi:uncharacterized protein LOC115623209 isoform X2 [Scaptodrosophila lebanonensis]|uniref:Uncharacterized protein LOC115623209 isoform X2 n=1 Tax=Drosophila lebanonensis TaxID=7225 RepID=A0A6J2TDV3_DROLE|nr:uncharacterized protein LOC115623209 isoform X2 [Scaptodrosophila lebanonensis]